MRKQAEEARVTRIERECGKIERVVATETKRRIEASKALQAMFENQLVQLQKDFREDLREAYEPLQEQIDGLIGRVERLEKTMEEEKRDREKEIQRANKEIIDTFSEHQKQFEVEKEGDAATARGADAQARGRRRGGKKITAPPPPTHTHPLPHTPQPASFSSAVCGAWKLPCGWRRQSENQRAYARLVWRLHARTPPSRPPPLAPTIPLLPATPSSGDEVFRLQQKITAERSSREGAVVLMKDDFVSATNVLPTVARTRGGVGYHPGIT